MSQHAILPEVITYSAIMRTSTKRNQPKRILEVLETLQQQAIFPDSTPAIGAISP